jgi:hypothetical protein
MSHCAEAEDRDELDKALYAPPGGWDRAEANVFKAIMSAPDADDTEEGAA